MMPGGREKKNDDTKWYKRFARWFESQWLVDLGHMFRPVFYHSDKLRAFAVNSGAVGRACKDVISAVFKSFYIFEILHFIGMIFQFFKRYADKFGGLGFRGNHPIGKAITSVFASLAYLAIAVGISPFTSALLIGPMSALAISFATLPFFIIGLLAVSTLIGIKRFFDLNADYHAELAKDKPDYAKAERFKLESYEAASNAAFSAVAAGFLTAVAVGAAVSTFGIALAVLGGAALVKAVATHFWKKHKIAKVEQQLGQVPQMQLAPVRQMRLQEERAHKQYLAAKAQQQADSGLQPVDDEPSQSSQDWRRQGDSGDAYHGNGDSQPASELQNDQQQPAAGSGSTQPHA